MRAKERILARKIRVLHFVWHSLNTSKGPVCVINKNKGDVLAGAFSASCLILHVRKMGKWSSLESESTAHFQY